MTNKECIKLEYQVLKVTNKDILKYIEYLKSQHKK